MCFCAYLTFALLFASRERDNERLANLAERDNERLAKDNERLANLAALAIRQYKRLIKIKY
jgi:hypothetical protein